MAYTAFITRIKNLRPHPNADRLQMGECFGNTVIVSLEYEDNQLGVYFPSDGQVSTAFAEANNLLRKKDADGNNIGGYMDPDKRNITAIKLRGEKSDGLFLPLKSLETFGDITTLHEGDRIDNFNGHEICCKYVPFKRERTAAGGAGKRIKRRAKRSIAPLFYEHMDTEQLAYNLAAFKPGDEIEITLKMHGTSQRTAHTKVLKDYCGPNIAFDIIQRKGVFKLFKPTDKMIDWAENKLTPIYDWGYISGTRRTVLENFEGGYYGSNEFREAHSKFFEGKLWKSETVYYEVVGFTHTGAPIMASCDNKKLNDKEFVKQYGKTTTFSYGCAPDGLGEVVDYWDKEKTKPAVYRKTPISDIYVYRMTMTNEDGDVIEYTPDFMRYRCEQMGVKTVPVMWKGVIPYTEDNLDSTIPGARIVLKDGTNAGDWVKKIAEKYYDGPDPIGKTHVREGVVVRILNRPKFCAYKHKNFSFKVLEGIIKDIANEPDIEEREDVTNE